MGRAPPVFCQLLNFTRSWPTLYPRVLGLEGKPATINNMLKRFTINSSEMIYRTDRLMGAATSRYRIVVQVARRAKRCRLEDMENLDDPMMKPVLRAVIEMSDELTEPELLGD